MKPAPRISTVPPIRAISGHAVNSSRPVGVVLSKHGFEELRSYGARFPCPVAVSPTAPREAIAWFFHAEKFAPFAHLVG